jgi:hypothetical protein
LEETVYPEIHIEHTNTLSSKCRVFSFNIKGAGAYSYHRASKGPLSNDKVYGRENARREPVNL